MWYDDILKTKQRVTEDISEKDPNLKATHANFENFKTVSTTQKLYF